METIKNPIFIFSSVLSPRASHFWLFPLRCEKIRLRPIGNPSNSRKLGQKSEKIWIRRRGEEKFRGRIPFSEVDSGAGRSATFFGLRSMDSDLWASHLFAAKRHYSLQHRQNPQSDRLGVDDFEMEEEVRPDFPCPYCYEDHDVTSLCSHLEDEHAFESKAADHLQRQRRSRRFAIPSSQTLSLLGRDLREAYLQLLLGTGTHRSSNTGASNTSADSFLSSVVLNFPTSETEESLKSSISTTEDAYMKKVRPSKTWNSSLDSSLSHEEREQKQKQATVRATFVQDLLLSALFGD